MKQYKIHLICVIINSRKCGGIGRREGLKHLYTLYVWVQVPSLAPIIKLLRLNGVLF